MEKLINGWVKGFPTVKFNFLWLKLNILSWKEFYLIQKGSNLVYLLGMLLFFSNFMDLASRRGKFILGDYVKWSRETDSTSWDVVWFSNYTLRMGWNYLKPYLGFMYFSLPIIKNWYNSSKIQVIFSFHTFNTSYGPFGCRS